MLALTAACATGAPSARRIPAPPVGVDAFPGGALEGSRQPIELLERRWRYRFEPDGRQVQTLTERYLVRSMEGLGPWAAVSATWSPWFQGRPELSASVTAPRGVAVQLDPSTASEMPVESEQGRMYTDRRRLEAMLAAFDEAAESQLQVIVFTCHEADFDQLGADVHHALTGTRS